jgi:hypothetical protein
VSLEESIKRAQMLSMHLIIDPSTSDDLFHVKDVSIHSSVLLDE